LALLKQKTDKLKFAKKKCSRNAEESAKLEP
jgi:hypothetical protein